MSDPNIYNNLPPESHPVRPTLQAMPAQYVFLVVLIRYLNVYANSRLFYSMARPIPPGLPLPFSPSNHTYPTRPIEK